MAARGAMRGARGCAFAVAAAWLAAVAHLAGGGGVPRPAGLLVAGVLAAAAGWYLSAGRRGALRIAVVLAPVQVGSHIMFMVTGRPVPVTPVTDAQAAHHAMAAMSGVSAAPMTMHHMSGGQMLLTHGVAVLATALLLGHGERLVWRLAAWLTAVLILVRTAVPSWEVPPRSRPGAREQAALPRLLVHPAVSRRGPPVVVPGV